MRITLTRSGGFTGIPLKKTIDAKTLAPAKAKEIQKLLTESQFFTMQKGSVSAASKPSPDRFTYTITINDAMISHTVDISEQSQSPEMRKLIEYLQKL